jgi:ketosteroid isomerase-like protein
MSIKLPKIVAAYVQAQNAHDAKSILACFSENALVHDEGEDHRGKKAIAEWIDKTTKKYKPHFRPTKIEVGDEETVLAVKVSGTFEGSPVDLDFHFVIKNEFIESLKIQ